MSKKFTWVLLIMMHFNILAPVNGRYAQAAVPVYQAIPYADELYQRIDFTDIDGHWAKTSIYRMAAQSILRGYGNQKFQPDTTLTKEQAVALVLRNIGLDEEAQVAGEVLGSGAANKPETAENLWALGYVQVALNRGIIVPQEQLAFEQNKTKPAQRQEVALWLARSLELPAVYGNKQQAVYGFRDWGDFNPNYLSTVEPLLQQEIMTGYDDGSFRPRAPLTRAEVAAILDRVSGLAMDKRGWGYLQGRITGKNQRWEGAGPGAKGWTELEIEAGGFDLVQVEFEEFGVGFPVLKNGALTKAHSLQTGDRLEIFQDNNGNVVFAQAFPGTRGQLTGFLTGISLDGQAISFQELSSGQKRSIPLSPQVTVTVDGRPASLNDLLAGQELGLQLVNNSVAAIEATLGPSLPGYTPARSGTKSGRIKEIDLDKLYLLENGQEKIYRLSAATQVVKGGKPLSLTELQVGDRIKLTIPDFNTAVISRIEVSSYEGTVDLVLKGRLNEVYPEGQRVSLSNTAEYFYGQWFDKTGFEFVELAPGTEIYHDSRLLSLEDLQKGYLGEEVYLTLTSAYGNYLGSRMLIKDGEARKYNGFIHQLSWPLSQFTLDNYSTSFPYYPGTIAVKNGKLVDAGDFIPEEHVFLETNYGNSTEKGTVLQSQEFISAGLRIYQGRIDQVGERNFEIDYYSEYLKHQWEEDSGRKEVQLTFNNDSSILDTVGINQLITPDYFAESRWSDYYDRREIIAVTDQDQKTLAMVIRRRNPSVLKTSIGRVVDVNLSNNTVAIDRVQDWSEGYQKWTVNPESLSLDLEDALLFTGSSQDRLQDVKIGDTVYVIHDVVQGIILFRQ